VNVRCRLCDRPITDRRDMAFIVSGTYAGTFHGDCGLWCVLAALFVEDAVYVSEN
jgi:hypothetical protein